MLLYPACWTTVTHFSLVVLPKNTGRLQLIQNSAARLLTKTKMRAHISPVLATLHWLPGTFRIDFKVFFLTYKALNGQGPNYTANSLTNYTPARTLRSSNAGLLKVTSKTGSRYRKDCGL